MNKNKSTPEVCGIPETKNAEPQVCGISETSSALTQHEPLPGRTNPIYKTPEDNLIIADPEDREALLALLSKEKSPASPNDMFIRILRNGPYLVYGYIPIKDTAIAANAQGESVGWIDQPFFEKKKETALCRCGHSKNMPFCDDTHSTIHFDGTCTASTESYDQAATIYKACPGYYLMDEVSLCAIVRYCDPDGTCWNLIKEADTIDTAIHETKNCASGRLTVVKDGKKIDPQLSPEIDCIYDAPRKKMGPLWVKGYVKITDENETQYEPRNRVTLCRCGASKNKPFCDGMHLKIEDKDIEYAKN